MFVCGTRNLEENEETTLRKWLEALNVQGLYDLIVDREFHGENATVPRSVRFFIDKKLPKIIASEAAVERCFSLHKLIHCPLRASLSDEVVNDILFVRYNYIWHFGNIFGLKLALNDSDAESIQPIDEYSE